MLHVIFGGQAQLLDYYPNCEPAAATPAGHVHESVPGERDWHRDFTFVRSPDGSPLMITVLIFMDDIWMRPWDMDLPLPQDARTGIPAGTERLLGLRCPGGNLYLVSQI
jgi:hypothetical protein